MSSRTPVTSWKGREECMWLARGTWRQLFFQHYTHRTNRVLRSGLRRRRQTTSPGHHQSPQSGCEVDWHLSGKKTTFRLKPSKQQVYRVLWGPWTQQYDLALIQTDKRVLDPSVIATIVSRVPRCAAHHTRPFLQGVDESQQGAFKWGGGWNVQSIYHLTARHTRCLLGKHSNTITEAGMTFKTSILGGFCSLGSTPPHLDNTHEWHHPHKSQDNVKDNQILCESYLFLDA